MPYLWQLLKMGALAATVALVGAHWLSQADSALVGVAVMYLLLVRAS